MPDSDLLDGDGVTVAEIESYGDSLANWTEWGHTDGVGGLLQQLEQEGLLAESGASTMHGTLRLGEMTSGVYYRDRVRAAEDSIQERKQILKELFAVDYEGPRPALAGGQAWTEATSVDETGVVAPGEMAGDVREELLDAGEVSTPVTDTDGIEVPDGVIADVRSEPNGDRTTSTAATSTDTTTDTTTDTGSDDVLGGVGRPALALAGVAVVAVAWTQRE